MCFCCYQQHDSLLNNQPYIVHIIINPNRFFVIAYYLQLTYGLHIYLITFTILILYDWYVSKI